LHRHGLLRARPANARRSRKWWLDARKPKVEQAAANMIDLAWNGLSQLDA